MDKITIAGEVFSVPLRYEEGHELTAAEATALNQAYHEALRNNFMTRVKAARSNGKFDLAALQAQLDEYALTYTFGARSRTRGATRGDPVQKVARVIAREEVLKAFRKRGYDPKRDIAAALIAEKVNEALQSADYGPKIMEMARTRVAEARSVDLTGLVTDI